MLETEKKLFFVEVYLIALNLNIVIFCAIYVTVEVFTFLQETYFTIIVQRNPLYQTGADLQESLMCIYDLSDISVGNNVNVGYVFVSLKMGFI